MIFLMPFSDTMRQASAQNVRRTYNPNASHTHSPVLHSRQKILKRHDCSKNKTNPSTCFHCCLSPFWSEKGIVIVHDIWSWCTYSLVTGPTQCPSLLSENSEFSSYNLLCIVLFHLRFDCLITYQVLIHISVQELISFLPFYR